MRVEIKARNSAELLRKIDALLSDETTDVYVNLRPTKEIIVRILENAPNIKVIGCPPSLYPKVSKKVISALKQLGVEVVPVSHPRGRPRKYDGDVVRQIRQKLRSGKSLREISKELNIPLRTLYYMLNGK